MGKIIKYLIILLCIQAFIFFGVRYFNTAYKRAYDENIINRDNDLKAFETEEKTENKVAWKDTEKQVNEETEGERVALVFIQPISTTEDWETYKYEIYKNSEGKYYYIRLENYGDLTADAIGERITDKGNIENKEQLNIIKKEIDKYREESFTDDYKNWGIYYKNEKLKSIEELAEILF